MDVRVESDVLRDVMFEFLVRLRLRSDSAFSSYIILLRLPDTTTTLPMTTTTSSYSGSEQD